MRETLLRRAPAEERVRIILFFWIFCSWYSHQFFSLSRWKESARSQCTEYGDCAEQQAAVLSLVYDLLLNQIIPEYDGKFEVCVFYKKDRACITSIVINKQFVTSNR